ncbi:hypothetical protein [Leporid alphaherpesvirus 4]|uniref:Uncharacterized protein n=1 Tax=Leporid alphaherpesvirus 4 TaxID=481315 RepID=J9R085_9ALPH|nr:hypothetical protein [Leporid alphaherpesvirus 4]AFR32492.1 hypothetical protein [Leporid alphaherpesvirus 4]
MAGACANVAVQRKAKVAKNAHIAALARAQLFVKEAHYGIMILGKAFLCAWQGRWPQRATGTYVDGAFVGGVRVAPRYHLVRRGGQKLALSVEVGIGRQARKEVSVPPIQRGKQRRALAEPKVFQKARVQHGRGGGQRRRGHDHILPGARARRGTSLGYYFVEQGVHMYVRRTADAHTSNLRRALRKNDYTAACRGIKNAHTQENTRHPVACHLRLLECKTTAHKS